ncbi:MAG: GMC family oxidoreductase, partial [Bacteroidota bacterium]
MQSKFDLVVVGTSFASTFFLKRYLEKAASDTKILVLERGFLFPHKDRLKAKTSNVKLSIEKAGRTYKTDASKIWVFDPNFGGSSNCWTACTPRFLPNDFKLRSKYGVGQDWPITYDDIEGYYNEVEKIMDVAGPSTTPFPKTAPYPLPPHKLSSVDKLLQAEYGDKYISQPAARASINLPHRGMCCTSSVCDLCPVNSKFTIENTLSSVYDDERVSLEYGCQVIGLGTTSDNAKSLTFIRDGAERTVQGETFAIGANAVFNAHILLNSGDGNENTGGGICEQVGRFARFYYNGLDNVGGGSIITANGYMMYDGDHRKD